MNRNELLSKLSELELTKSYLKRQLDINYFDYKKRTSNFNKLKKVQKEIQEVKFKLKLIKEITK